MRLRDIPRIRWKLAEDQQVIATAKRNPFRKDELFEDLGRKNRFGIHWIRETPQKARNAERLYRKHLTTHGVAVDGEQIADWDGILYFVTTDPDAIPEWFKRSKSQIAAGKRLAKKHGFKKSPPLGARFGTQNRRGACPPTQSPHLTSRAF